MKRFLRPRNLIPALSLLAGLLGAGPAAAQVTLGVSDGIPSPRVEGAGNIIFDVTIVNNTMAPVNVSFTRATSNGSAVAPGDYTALPAAVSGPHPVAGGAFLVVQFPVTVIDDNVFEPANETFNFNVTGVVNATLIDDGVGVGTIQDNDPIPTVTITNVTQLETDAGTTNFQFQVSLSNPSQETITLSRATADGNDPADPPFETNDALSSDDPLNGIDNDFEALVAANISFTPGTTGPININVTVNGDTAFELNDQFRVILTPVAGQIQPVPPSDLIGLGTITNDDTPPFIGIGDVTVDEGHIGDTNIARFPLFLTNATFLEIHVDAKTLVGDGTSALPNQDFLPFQGDIVIPPGAIGANPALDVEITIVGDRTVETNETFWVEIQDPFGAFLDTVADGAGPTPGDERGVGTINNDDVPVLININNTSVAEGTPPGTGNQLTFDVTLSNPVQVPVTVQYSIGGGTATNGIDYVPNSGGTLTFAPGDTLAQIVVSTVPDSINEPDETFLVTLSAESAGNPDTANIADGSGEGTITNDDAQLNLTIADDSETEGTGGGTPNKLIFQVDLSGVLTSAVSVQYRTVDGPVGFFGARGSLDYIPATGGTITFQPGEQQQFIEIPIIADAIDENNETMTVELYNLQPGPAVVAITDGTATGTILDDDLAPTIAINDVTVCEDDGVAIFTITKSAISGLISTVDVDTLGVTATEGVDYVGVHINNFAFQPEELVRTVSVTIIDDNQPDNSPTFAPETFQVNLSDLVNLTLAGSDLQGIGTILDDEGLIVDIVEIPVDGDINNIIDIVTNPQKCFRITLTNQCGDIVPFWGDDADEGLQVQVDGNTGSDQLVDVVTDDEGEVIFCYTPLFPGSDTVTALAFVKGVLVDSDSVVVNITLAATRDARIEGSGYVDAGGGPVVLGGTPGGGGGNGAPAYFSLNSSLRRNGRVQGSVNVEAPFFGSVGKFRSARIDALIAGDAFPSGGHAAILFGTGKLQVQQGRNKFKETVRFRVDVLDNGTPGVPNDRFVLTLLSDRFIGKEGFSSEVVVVGGALKHARGVGVKNDVKIDLPGLPIFQ